MKFITAILLTLLISVSSVVAAVTIKLRGDTAANWTANNPVLALREPGVETDTNKLKIGDGATAWNTLPYVAGEGGGPVDLTAPGPIGSVTPNTGAFTDLSAQSFEPTAPDTGETGEISLREDPANGSDAVTFKAPASVSGDLVFIVPGADGDSGDAMVTNGAKILSFVKMLRASNNLSDVKNKPLAVTNLGAMPAPVAVPASATASCTAPAWAFNATYLYLCPTNNTWVRVAVATW